MNKNRPIRVLHIASGDLWAGAEVQLFTLSKALNNLKDIKIDVVLLNHGLLKQKLHESHIDVTVLDESELNGFQIFLQLIGVIRKIQPDVIHTHRGKENILGSIAALFSNIPTLRTAHGASEHKPAWHHFPKRLISFTDWFCGRFLQRKIIAVSNDLAEILQNDFPADRISVIENGIDLTSLKSRSTSVEQEPVNSYTETNVRPFKVGIAGRLVPVKRVDLFIEAAADLFNAHPELDISFHIFGDGPLRLDLEALNQKLGTDKALHFEGHCENIHQELANLDILLITSDHEGLPMVLLEAMALKIPIIAHAVGGIPTVLDEGECGLLVSEHQAAAYSDAIYHLIKNPENRKKYIDNAYNRVTCFYSSEQNANAYHVIYKQLTL
jgi:glycosyltransferase involved in cell wall biosynthesis